MTSLDELLSRVGEAAFSVLEPGALLYEKDADYARIFGAEGEEIRVMPYRDDTPEQTRERARALARILNWCEGLANDA